MFFQSLGCKHNTCVWMLVLKAFLPAHAPGVLDHKSHSHSYVVYGKAQRQTVTPAYIYVIGPHTQLCIYHHCHTSVHIEHFYKGSYMKQLIQKTGGILLSTVLGTESATQQTGASQRLSGMHPPTQLSLFTDAKPETLQETPPSESATLLGSRDGT